MACSRVPTGLDRRAPRRVRNQRVHLSPSRCRTSSARSFADAGALLGVRPGLQRPAREGRSETCLARRLEPLLADAPRADRPDGALRPRRTVGDRALRQPRQRPRPSPIGPLACPLPDRDAARGVRDRGRDPETVTTTSPCRRSRRCSGTSRSSSGLVDRRVPQAHGVDTKLYVYAGSILAATFIQVLLPLPWLRGLERGEERLFGSCSTGATRPFGGCSS